MATTRVVRNKPAFAPPCDPAAELVEVTLPGGYVRVWSPKEPVRGGDLYLNAVLLREGEVSWDPVNPPSPTELRRREPYAIAGHYTCLIRKGEEDIGLHCVRCRAVGRDGKFKYCAECLAAPDALTWNPRQEVTR